MAAAGLHVLWLKVCSMDESIFCARMCIHQIQMKKKKKPLEKGDR
jgi:hypothetical protein